MSERVSGARVNEWVSEGVSEWVSEGLKEREGG